MSKTEELTEKKIVESYAYACEQVQNLYPEADCRTIEPPLLILTTLVEELGAWGVYMRGEPFIFVTPDNPYLIATIIHEMTHYILFTTGAETDRCRHEEVARFVAGQSRPWRKQYGCTGDARKFLSE